MLRRISNSLGITLLVTALLVSVATPLITQSNALALSAPKIGFQQQTPYFDEDNSMSSSAGSAIGPSNQLYEIGWIKGTVDVNPGAGVDNRTVQTGTSYVRVMSSAGNYVKVRILEGVDADSYANVRGIAFNADKTSYYLAGQFHGSVDFDMTAGEAVRATDSEDTYIGFVAKYQSSDDSLVAVQTFDGAGSSLVDHVAYSAVHDTIAISGSLSDGADPNPTAADETVTLVSPSSTNAAFVSLYGADLTYDHTMVYTIGQANSTTDVNDIAYNPDNGMLAVLIRMSANNQTFTMQFDPVGETGDQDVTLDNNRAASAIVFIDDGDYAGILPIALDTSMAKYESASYEVEYIDYDASGNLYYAGEVWRADEEIPVDFDFDVFGSSGDTHTLPDVLSHYVTKLTPGEGYNYDSTFFYPNPIPADYMSENDLTGMFVDSSGNVYLSGYWYVEGNEGDDVYDVNPGAATDMRTVNDSTTFVIQVNDDMSFGYILTNGTNMSDVNEVWPNDVSLVRDASGNMFATSNIWYLTQAQDADTCEMGEQWLSTVATVKLGSSGSSASGWLDFAPASDRYVEGCDADNDGISDADEGSIVGGDANGDEIPDREQAHVSAMTNPVTDSAVVLEVDGACTLSDVSVKSEAQTGSDALYSYPLGLLDFTATCGASGFTSTIKQIYYNPPVGDFVLRKFANGSYQTITGATITRTTLNGQSVLVVTYSVKDGGLLDADGEENGVIVDPAGLASLVVPGAPNTGYTRQDSSSPPLIIGTLTVMASVMLTIGYIRSRKTS